ncbi:degenerate transposase (orf2) [Streptococcus pneumoniae]|nr:degenerate transposase (orf2) [Streptococcus pneumoniae]
MTEFSLVLLLKAIKLARSTYYYYLKQLDKPDKDQELKAEIQSIFIEHKGNYTPNHSYLSQLDVTYKTPDLMSHFLPPHEVSFTFCCSSIVFPR